MSLHKYDRGIHVHRRSLTHTTLTHSPSERMCISGFIKASFLRNSMGREDERRARGGAHSKTLRFGDIELYQLVTLTKGH
jgi:hypothetical protein